MSVLGAVIDRKSTRKLLTIKQGRFMKRIGLKGYWRKKKMDMVRLKHLVREQAACINCILQSE